MAARVTVMSLNTRGVPVLGSRLAERYAVIGQAVEEGDADVACFQEVFSWWHLRMLTRRMRSFRQVSFRRSVAGPAGGLVTVSRLAVSGTAFRGFGIPPGPPGISPSTRLTAALKGVLVTRLAFPAFKAALCVVNTHPVANRDGDWSTANRHHPVHRAQLEVLTRVVRGVPAASVVCGDFNVDRDSSLFAGFLAATGLTDAFGGTCPATFRAEYLPAGASPHCIDFILTGGGVKADSATVTFGGKEPLAAGPGYVSDHVGLQATLCID